MTPKTLAQNVGLYVLIALLAAILATGTQLGTTLQGTDPVAWRPLAATFVATLFGTLTTAGLASLLPRAGSELLARLVNEIGKPQAKAALEVEAIKRATGAGGLTAEQRLQILADLKADLTRDPEGDDPPTVGDRIVAELEAEERRGGGRG